MRFERGKIRNAEYAQILRDFSKLRWGAITPTDIDGFLDFGNRAFVFIEAKHKGAVLSGGQKLALERLVDACAVPAILLIAQHETKPGEVIEMSICLVLSYRLKRKWRVPRRNTTVRQAVDDFLSFVGYFPRQSSWSK